MSSPDEQDNPPEAERPRLMAFNDVTMRVFPLRASLHRLRLFCAQYLNIAPEIVRYEPALPFVFFMMVNYGKMTSTTSNEGWIAQNEFLFNVPLIEYLKQDGRWIPGTAATAPFIFVDDHFSVVGGREIAGLPKVKAELKPSVDPWTRDPRSRRPLTTLKTEMFSELFAGQRVQPEVLLEIDRELPPTLFEFPTGFGYFLRPLAEIPLSAARSAVDLLELATGLNNILGTGDWRRGLLSMWSRAVTGLRQTPPRIHLSSVNLKQFRSSGNPALAAYQAILRFNMSIVRLNACGLLGGIDFLRGDPGAGFRIRIHQQKAFPIIDALGIETTRESRLDRQAVATVHPVLPFWFLADLNYDGAKRICWRTERSDWHTRNENPTPEIQDRQNPYITTLGPLVNPPAGPFYFKDVTLRVIKLPADPKKLEHFALDIKGLGRFECTEPHVLLFVTTYGEMSSDANNAGWWADRELAFVIPARFVGEENEYPFVFWPAHYVNNPIAVSTGREVTGLPTAYGFLNNGVDPWLTPDPNPQRRVFDMRAMVFPGLGMGQTSQKRLLMKVLSTREEGEFIPMTDSPRQTSQNMSLKRFQDAENPDRYCYEALIANGVNYRVKGRRVGGAYSVFIRHYDSDPIVDFLGLEAKDEFIERGVRTYRIESLASNIMKLDVRYDLGECIVWRTFGGDWQGTASGLRHLKRIFARGVPAFPDWAHDNLSQDTSD